MYAITKTSAQLSAREKMEWLAVGVALDDIDAWLERDVPPSDAPRLLPIVEPIRKFAFGTHLVNQINDARKIADGEYVPHRSDSSPRPAARLKAPVGTRAWELVKERIAAGSPLVDAICELSKRERIRGLPALRALMDDFVQWQGGWYEHACAVRNLRQRPFVSERRAQRRSFSPERRALGMIRDKFGLADIEAAKQMCQRIAENYNGSCEPLYRSQHAFVAYAACAEQRSKWGKYGSVNYYVAAVHADVSRANAPILRVQPSDRKKWIVLDLEGRRVE